MDTVEKLKSNIEKLENGLKNPVIPENLKAGMKTQIAKLNEQLKTAEAEAAKAVEKAKEEAEKKEKELAEAEKKSKEAKKGDNTNAKKRAAEKLNASQKEVTKAKGNVDKAKADEKKVDKLSTKVNAVVKKADKAINDSGKHGGHRPNAGRKTGLSKKKATDLNNFYKTTIFKDGDVKEEVAKKMLPLLHKELELVSKSKKKTEIDFVKAAIKTQEDILNPKPKLPRGGAGRGQGRIGKKGIVAVKEKPKEITIFGKKVSWNTNAEFCEVMRKAYLERRSKSKQRPKGQKTKPIFDVITHKVAGALSSAVKSIPQSRIEKNPKQFLKNFIHLEKLTKQLLEGFKEILGSDYKKSEIAKELGEVEKTITNIMSKLSKK